MNCCTTISNSCPDALCFGTFAFCAKVNLPIESDAIGLHYFEVYGNHPQEIRFDVLGVGDVIQVDMKWFNETEQVFFKIRKPDDTYLTYEYNAVEYDKFCIRSRWVSYYRDDLVEDCEFDFEEVFSLG